MAFEKIYVLDTNIILNDVTNLEILSQQSSNLIVIPETVVDELDVKKIGFDEINYQARAFGRLLEKAEILYVNQEPDKTISRMFINHEKNMTIDIISLKDYEGLEKVDKHIINDRKILEVAKKSSEIYEEPVIFVSNDVMCRLRAISLGIVTEAFGKDTEELEFYAEIEYSEDFPSAIDKAVLEVKESIFGLCLYNSNGNRKYYYKSGNTFFQVDDDELKKQNIKPMNIEQRIYSSLILDPFYDVVVVDAPAGSGKTALALSGAMKLIDKNRDRYNKIIYMRKTVTADNEEMGFLPGTQEEKLSPYMAPLFSNLEAIVNSKYNQKKKFTKEELESKILDLVKEYQITPMFEGFLRGTNLRDAIVIIDECLHKDSTIHTNKGLISIAEICDLIARGELVDAMSYNFETNCVEFKPIDNVVAKPIHTTDEKMYQITLEDGSDIKVTGNHKLFIDGEYKTVNSIIDDGETHYLFKNNLNECIDMQIIKIKEIEYKDLIYTPEVQDNHNYFMGDACVLSKNCQNESVSSIRTSLTRVTEGCKVIAIGSNKQIDNKYINKHTSALTYLSNKTAQDNGEVNVCGIKLTKTVRSRIAEWADEFK